MRTIIAGSRSITDYAVVEEAVRASGIQPSVVLSGAARGVDVLGERWAADQRIPLERYPADWDRLGRGAGFVRNLAMAKKADALIAVWDGASRGTRRMIQYATDHGLKVYVHDLSASPEPEEAPK